MTTMQALVAHAIGEPAEVLRLETRPIPQPGRGEVRIRVLATPVHPSDLHILRGRFGIAPTLPAVMGSESVGVVDALGEGVDDVSIGQQRYHRWREGNVAGVCCCGRQARARGAGGGERIDRGADDYKSADRAVAGDKST